MVAHVNTDRKARLIEALQKEQAMLKGKRLDTSDHVYTIMYLQTGEVFCKDSYIVEYDLLDAAVNDLETLMSDYNIE